MTEFFLVLLGGGLSIAGGVVAALFREREAVRREDRAETRGVRRVIFALLCVRDEIRELATSLDFLPVLEPESPAHEEQLRQDVIADRREAIDTVVEQVEALLPGLSEVDPFAANLAKINIGTLAKQIRQDYLAVAGDPERYKAFREKERERLDDMMNMIDVLFDHLAEEAELPAERIQRAIQAKETRIAALQAAGIGRGDRPPDDDP